MPSLIDRVLARAGFERTPLRLDDPLTPAERLALTLRPQPDLRERRLRALSPDRRIRFLANIADMDAEARNVGL